MANNSNNKFKIGPDGVAQIYPDGKGSQVYMGNKGEFDDEIFNVSYGKNSHIDYDAKKEGKLNYFNTEGSPINYHSGAQSGRSTRIDTYAGKGMWDNDTEYYYKDNPGYLYNKKGTLNSEFTTYIRVHGSLGTHQAYAHKIGGRDEDALRSLAEMVYPTEGKDQVAFNYNYAHFPYVHVKAKTLQDLDAFGDEYGWLALKTIHIVKDDYTHWEMWADTDPIGKDGSINNNWEKIAEYKDEGCDEYDNIPVQWRAHKQVCRVDGFESVDFALFSDREIDASKGTTLGKEKDEEDAKKEKVVLQQSVPVIANNASGISDQEVQAAQDWLKKCLNTRVVDIINQVSKQGSVPKPGEGGEPNFAKSEARPPSAAEQAQDSVAEPDAQSKTKTQVPVKK